jgi:coenzyme F420-dependent glucose-6-phosphate dehydrogenase
LLGYHVSHEQFPPSKLLDLTIEAERAGFEGMLSSDHFYPWSKNQAQSGFAWSWLGAAMYSTSCSFGIVTAPSYRYHPAIIAQASATLSEMFPNRFWLCLGSGELLNEGITGAHWPAKGERNQRLKESADIIKRLWKGETVTHHGLVIVDEAHLYTRPKKLPMLMGAAMSPETAKWLGSWADGLVTVGSPKQVKEIINSFRQGGGNGKPVYVKMEVSYAPSYEDALESAMQQWKYTVLGSSANTMFRLPEMFDEACRFLRPEDIASQICVSHDSEEHIQRLRVFMGMGVENLIVHNVNLEQKRFIEFYKKEVLPHLKDSSNEEIDDEI